MKGKRKCKESAMLRKFLFVLGLSLFPCLSSHAQVGGIQAQQTAETPLQLRVSDGDISSVLGTFAFKAINVVLTPSASNYIYLDLTQSPPVLMVNTTGFPNTSCYKIATAVTNATQITSLTDSRPSFNSTIGGGGLSFVGQLTTLVGSIQNKIPSVVASVSITNQGTPASTTVYYTVVPCNGSGQCGFPSVNPSTNPYVPYNTTTSQPIASLTMTNYNTITATVGSDITSCQFIRGNGTNQQYILGTSAVSGGSCSWNDQKPNNTGLTQEDAYGLLTAGFNTPLINNVVFLDGCTNVSAPRYACTSTGLQKAMADADGHGGVAGVVVIPPTANCVASVPPSLTVCNALQAVNLGSTTIEVPTLMYIIGYGRNASEFDYTSTGCAFDFAAGTRFSGLIGIGVEQDSGNASTGVCFEGTSALPTYGNTIKDVYIANNVGQFGYVTSQTGIKLTPTPTGANGALYIHDNLFEDVYIGGIYTPVVSNGDQNNRWRIQISGEGTSQVAFNGCFVSDIGTILEDDSQSGAAATNSTVAWGDTSSACTNNKFDITSNLLGTGVTMLNDSGNGNDVTVTDSENGSAGTVSAQAPPAPHRTTGFCSPSPHTLSKSTPPLRSPIFRQPAW